LEEAEAEALKQASRRNSTLVLFSPVELNRALVVQSQGKHAGDTKARLHFKVSRKIKASYVFLVVFAALGVVCQIVEAELVFKNGDVGTPLTNPLKTVVSVSTFFLLWLIYVHYCDVLLAGQLQGLYHEHDTLGSTQLLRSLVTELFVCAVHCPPTERTYGLSILALGKWSHYTADAVASVLICARVYLIVRYVHDRHGSQDSVAAMCLKGFGLVDFTPWHTFKSLLASNGLSVVFRLFVLMVCLHAHALRVAERPTQEAFLEWWSCVWCAIVTMTTVGYGDMFPTTYVGRLIGVSAAIVGTIILALLVTSVTSATELTKAERNVEFMVRVQSIQNVNTHQTHTWTDCRGQIKEAPQGGCGQNCECSSQELVVQQACKRRANEKRWEVHGTPEIHSLPSHPRHHEGQENNLWRP
jgi:hypothetical protein